MRKFLTLAASVAALALGSVTPAKAFDSSLMTGSSGASTPILGAALGGVFVFVLGKAVVDDVLAGGLNRKFAEVTPGAGFQSRDYATAAKLTHEFNVAMGYTDDAATARYLASAAK